MQQITPRLIEYRSREFELACRLRYELFFARHNLPLSIVRDPQQQDYFHGVIIKPEEVIAYGQLVPHPNKIYQVCQMVVAPAYQQQGFGRQILLFLIDLATQKQAIALTLNARLTAIGFYQKLGFQTHGKQFPSQTTGVMHITMNRKL
ncbi:MAG: GNAT family N-acetyltransferase [Cyanobacteria bacterium J06623_7]